MMNTNTGRITLRRVRIGRGSFRNFAGKRTEFNKDGKHRFTIFLDDVTANELKANGWNVRYFIPKGNEEDASPLPILDVELRYDNYPPRVLLATGDVENPLEEEDLYQLDDADIIDADVQLSPYSWTNAKGESGIKAYARQLRVRVDDDF